MKAGDAVMLRLAARFGVPGAQPARDLTFVFYDNEEVEAVRNGLGRVARERRGWLVRRPGDPAGAHRRGDRGRLPGHPAGGADRAGEARAQRPLLAGRQRRPRRGGRSSPRSPGTGPGEVEIDGLTYREGLNAVRIEGGVAGNVLPDELRGHRELPLRPRPRRGPGAERTSARSSPRRSPPGRPSSSPTPPAARCPGWPSRRPRRSSPRSGSRPRAKLGWTDVARFAALRHPGAQLRPGRPEPGPHRRRVRPHRPAAAGRGRPDRLPQRE